MPVDDAITRDILVVWLVLLGSTIGSFLNVVIARVPAGQSIVRPRSRCPRCGAPIHWYDNVPIVSWFVLRGRCRACRGRISPRYPAVEAAIAAAAVAAYLRHGVSPMALGELVAVALLVALALIDLDTWLLPHALTAPLAIAGLGLAVFGWGPAPGLGSAALGALVGFAVFGGIWLLGEKVLRREVMGLGDAFLLGGIGAWMGLPALLPVVLLASLQGAVVGLVLLALGRGEPGAASSTSVGRGADAGGASPEAAPRPAPTGPVVPADAAGEADADWTPPRHAVPFGPFLALGALEWLYLASRLAEGVPALGVFR